MELTVGPRIAHGHGTLVGLIPLEYPVLGLPPSQSAEIRTYVGDPH